MVKRYRKKRVIRRKRKRAITRDLHTMMYRSPGTGNLSPFPPKLNTALTFSYTGTLVNSTPGIPGNYLFALNGLGDPSKVLGADTPRYFNTLCGVNDSFAPYQYYRVNSSRIAVTVWPISTSAAAANVVVSVIPKRSTVTSPNTLIEMENRPYAKLLKIGSFYRGGPKTISNYMKVKTLIGIKDVQDAPGLQAPSSANPLSTNLCEWDVSIVDIGETSAANARMEVKITYYATFMTLNDVFT